MLFIFHHDQPFGGDPDEIRVRNAECPAVGYVKSERSKGDSLYKPAQFIEHG